MAAATKTDLSWGEMFIVCDLPDRVVDLIGDLGVHPVTSDAPRRVGEIGFLKSNKNWHELTTGGRHRLTQARQKQCNALVGSAFNPTIIAVPCLKENMVGCTPQKGT